MSRHAATLLPLLLPVLLAAGCGGDNAPATTPATAPATTPAGGNPSAAGHGAETIRRFFVRIGVVPSARGEQDYDLSKRAGVSWTPQELPAEIAGGGAFVLDLRFSTPDGPLQPGDLQTVLTRADGTTTEGDGRIRVSLCRFERFTVTLTSPASSTYTGQRERFVFVVGGNERGVDATAPRPRWCGYEPPPESKRDRLHEVAVHFTDYYRRFDDLDTRTGISWTPGELPAEIAGPFVLNIQFAASLDSGPRAFSTTLRRADGTITEGDGHIRVSLCRFERFLVTATTAGDDTYAPKTTRLAFTVGGNANGVSATAPPPDWCGGEPVPPGPVPPEPEPGAFGTPGGLRVASTGPDFIEWSWEPVEDATSYTLQIDVSTPYTFSPPSASRNTTDTSLRVELRPETVAYGRVRANAGTRAAPIRSDWSEPVSGTSGAAGLVLGVPEPEVLSTTTDSIAWVWEPVEDATSYTVQVDITPPYNFTPPSAISEVSRPIPRPGYALSPPGFRLDVRPLTTAYIRVRVNAGTRAAPIRGDWSEPVMGISKAALSLSMTPPQAGADPDCSGQAFCPDNKPDTDPTATASPNPRMLVSFLGGNNRVAFWAAWIESEPSPSNPDGGPAHRIDLNRGDNTPFVSTDWPILRSKLADEGAVFVFHELDGDSDPEIGPPLYITCSISRCSAPSLSQPARPR